MGDEVKVTNLISNQNIRDAPRSTGSIPNIILKLLYFNFEWDLYESFIIIFDHIGVTFERAL